MEMNQKLFDECTQQFKVRPLYCTGTVPLFHRERCPATSFRRIESIVVEPDFFAGAGDGENEMAPVPGCCCVT